MKYPMMLCVALLCLMGGGVNAQVSAEPSASLRAEVAMPLKLVQDLLKSRDYAAALAKLGEVDKLSSKTAVEIYLVERLRATAASGLGNIDQALKSLETAMATGQTPTAEEAGFVLVLVNGHYQLQHYVQAMTWSKRYLVLGGQKDQQVRLILAQSLYLVDDFKAAAQELGLLSKQQRATNQIPTQAQLELWASCYLKIKDDAGYMTVLEQLLIYHPKKQHWEDLLARLERRPGFSEPLAIDLFRLQWAAGALTEPNDYLELAQMAQRSGYPAEAKQVLQTGFAAKVLGNGADADKHQRYLQQVSQRSGDDLRTLAAPEAQARAAKDGNILFNLGYNHASHGQTEMGLSMMQRALDAGSLRQPDEARLRLAVVYERAGQRGRAKELLLPLKGLSRTDGLVELARLWDILLTR